ncbi:RNA-binding protein 41 [Bombina bombina]|uniref:RNA-binding protein 41 n=1 Tax=Bombina bombina TaxID=8345 RepID=UPI00235AB299|nr:RNA-binding protein 41 [Bombina bombina]
MKRAILEPSEPYDLETEGERQLKLLFHNQLDKKASLESCVSHRTRFAPGSLYEPLTSRSAGTHSLNQFRDLQDKESERDALRDLGLSDSDIQLWKDPESFGKADPHAVRSRRSALEHKVAERLKLLNLPQHFAGSKKLNRREMEIERAMFQGTDRQHFLRALYHQSDTYPTVTNLEEGCLSNTLNHVGAVEKSTEQTMDHASTTKSSTEQSLDHSGTSEERLIQTLSQVGAAERIRNVEETLPSALPPTLKAGHTLASLGSGGTFGAVREVVPTISEEEIKQNRASQEEICSLSRQGEYHPGEPNRVLHIRNLSSQVALRDLVGLFSRFQSSQTSSSNTCTSSSPSKTLPSVSHSHTTPSNTLPSSEVIHYRVLTGRLRGQAFITLPDAHVAKSALQLLLGYQLHGRPMIITFAKKSPGTEREEPGTYTWKDP